MSIELSNTCPVPSGHGLLASVDKRNPVPRHAQVQAILRNLVTSGQWKAGDKIPAELDLAASLGVSKMTVNKALLALTSEGLFTREVGRGTFVAAPPLLAGRDTKATSAAATVPAASPRIRLSFVEGASDVLESHYYGSLCRAVQAHFAQRNVAAQITLSSLTGADYLAEDGRDPADGWLIVAPRAETLPSIEALWQSGRAVVVVGASWPQASVPSVDSDNVGGAMMAVRHLAELGHKRIGLLYAEEETANTRDRIAGYRHALGALGLPHEAAYEVRAEAAWRTGAAAGARLRDLFDAGRRAAPPVTAVFAAGFYLALEAMNAARAAGRCVPEQVSVVGFDDPLPAQMIWPALSTVRQPLDEMGRRAGQRLLHLLGGEEPRLAIREALPAHLIVRGSTAAPAPAATPFSPAGRR